MVRSDPVADPEDLARLYARSSFDYSAELPHLRSTYGRYLRRVGGHSASRGKLLEVGCGNGFFLEEAMAQGYREVWGVEPGRQAAELAPRAVRRNIVVDVMRPGLFPPSSFDVICMFQVFDHLSEPGQVLDECLAVLRPGGAVLCLNHNVESLSARLLGERSPIVDVEHTYLYSPKTLARIFSNHGFEVVEQGIVYNTYSFHYLMRLVPLPPLVKRKVLDALAATPAGRLPVSVPLGNLFLIARKPGLEDGGHETQCTWPKTRPPEDMES